MCSACDKKPRELSDWFYHINHLYRLQKAGYPFRANDLTLDEWYDVGVLTEELEAYRMAGDKLYGK